jgi:formylglycine-generating enzyme required for sulfatase activity
MRSARILFLFLASCPSNRPGPAVTTTGYRARDMRGMVHVDGAEFRMGTRFGEPSEQPRHDARVEGFDIDVTEVTVDAFTRCVRAGACAEITTTTSNAPQRDPECNGARKDRFDHPVNCVDWQTAEAYCRWMGKRLPTEVEWEYAACGNDCAASAGQRNGEAAIFAVGRFPFTSPVASGSSGVFGLYDMGGDVWEWTSSRLCPYDDTSCDDAHRVIRGGSWPITELPHVRFTAREGRQPEARDTNVGFRCARSSP